MSEKSNRVFLCISFILILALMPISQTIPINLVQPQTASAQGIINLSNHASNSSKLTSSPFTITLSNFNAGVGSNRLLVVGVEANNQSVNSVTFGGISLTKVAGSFHNQYTAFWYLTNPSGNGNIVVTMAGATQVVIGAYAFYGVDQSNPIPTTATYFGSGNPSISLNTLYSNSTIVDSASIFGAATLSSPTCTSEWNVNMANKITGASSLTTKTTPGSVTCSWTASIGGDGWDDAAIEIKASGVNNPLTNILLNGKSTAAGHVGTSSSAITIYKFKPGAESNRLMVVGVEANEQSVNSITFGGVSLTQAVSSFTNNDAEFWYLKNPSSTPADLVVTMSGGTHSSSFVIGAYSFFGVNQTAPIATTNSTHNTSASSPSISITTKYYNSKVLDSPSIFGGATLGSPTCTQQWDVNVQVNSINKVSGASSSTIPKAPGKVTCSWTASAGELWDDVAIEIRSYNPSTGVLIPLYDYPNPPTEVNSAINSHNAHPSVRMIGIINENSGNPVPNDSNWATAVTNLQKAGIVVLGYVATGYDCTDAPSSCQLGHTAQSLSSVEAEMKNYSNFYNVNGTFFDEMSNNANSGNLTFYGNLNSYAKNYLNETFTVGNPGTQTDEKFNGTLDNLVVWENTSLPPINSYSAWNSNYNKNLFSVLAFGIPGAHLNSTYYNSTAKHVGYLYFTDGCCGNQWFTTSSYLNSTLGNLTHD
jgi:hypothetical protein